MSRPIRYRMPDGAEIVSESDGTVTISVTMPADDAGHIGQQCPSCKHMFRMRSDDYAALPDNQRLTCPYCCAEDDHSEFVTEQQVERGIGAVAEYGQQRVEQELDAMLDKMVRTINSHGGAMRASRSGSRSVRSPRPLPPIVEEAPIRERSCDRCRNRYAVFGEHVACPVCGRLPPASVARDALAAHDELLAIFDQLPVEERDRFREAGAVEKSAGDALGSVVSTLETFLKQTFLDRVPGGDAIIAPMGNVFQRLDDAANLYKNHLAVDLIAALGTADWDRLSVLYGIRHLLTHTNGFVDARHVARFPGKGFVLGQHVRVLTADTREAIQLARNLLDALP